MAIQLVKRAAFDRNKQTNSKHILLFLACLLLPSLNFVTVFVSIIYGRFVSAVVSAVPLRCLCGACAVPLRCLCGASADASAVKEQTSEQRMSRQKRAKNETERRAKAPP